MSKRTTFVATDSQGKQHRRTTNSRTYTHVVVVRTKPTPPSDMWPKGWPGSIKSEWAGNLLLAENNARRWRAAAARDKSHVESVEICEAQQLPERHARSA